MKIFFPFPEEKHFENGEANIIVFPCTDSGTQFRCCVQISQEAWIKIDDHKILDPDCIPILADVSLTADTLNQSLLLRIQEKDVVHCNSTPTIPGHFACNTKETDTEVDRLVAATKAQVKL